MSTIVTRSGKGSPLTHNEVDTNFTNLNTDKVEKTSADITGGTINNTVIGGTTPAAGTFTTLNSTSTATLGGDATNPSLVAAAVSSPTRWLQISGSSAGNVTLAVQGTGTPNLILQNRSTGSINFATANSASNVQFVASHTASAVNYVQVTGAATGSSVVVSSQGSDTNIGMIYNFKGTASHSFNGNNGTHFQVTSVASGANFLRATGAAASSAPVLSAQGSDTNIDLTLTPKGTGNVRFGTYTGTILTPTGYVEIKDSGGTVRRLLVG